MTNDKDLDPNLQAPQEANTTKHINFLEAEENAASNNGDSSADLKEDDSPTKRQWQEMRNELRGNDS
jgi:hypothetical protein